MLASMAAEFILGASASCTDGHCGVISRTILDPAARTVTHLVIEPKHHAARGRLVPVGLVDAASADPSSGSPGDIRLTCSLAEFERLDPAEEVDVVQDEVGEAVAVQGYGGVGAMGVGGSVSGLGIGMPAQAATPYVVTHAVPLGEAEVQRHEPVHAADGEIGKVDGFVVDPRDGKVTHVLLQEGHLWGRKEVAIPVGAVTAVDEGIRLSLTRQQIADLPPLGS
jgi:hypothetical protein